MKEILNLMKRNILVFVRDRDAVFFSVLSMLIVLGLMVLFLGKMNSENIVELLGQMGENRNPDTDRANAEYLVQMWTLAGILVVNCVTVTMTVMGNMVNDETNNRLASLYVTPVKRIQIALGYIISAWLIGIMMCLLTLIVAEGYFAINAQKLLSGEALFKLFGMIVLNALLYAAIAYLIALFIHSESAWSGLLTVIGTLVGFVGAIYLPMVMLPEKVASVLKCLPVLHGAAIMREICTEEALKTTFGGMPEEVIRVFKENMGITIVMDESVVPLSYQIAFLVILSIVVMIAASIVSRRKAVKDR